jgi:NADPH:quinone reductase-like Zn-dependent oxidoreductase
LNIVISSAGSAAPIELDLKALYRNEHSVVGCNSVGHTADEMAEFLDAITPHLESGELKAPDTSRYTEVSLEKVAEVYQELLKGNRTKYVIVKS